MTAPSASQDAPVLPPHRGTHPHAVESVKATLLLAALGVVFGDIGTSPLYAFQTVFSLDGGIVKASASDVYGVVSLMFWAVTVIVSVKYIVVIMRADNDGEGGVMALAALTRRLLGEHSARSGYLVALAVAGASLFYGDSVITPAISVLSAVEGLKVPFPGVAHLVVPVALVILTVLFASQRFGTAKVGKLFGPVMVVWFGALAALGVNQAVRRPGIVLGLSPTYAGAFVVHHPFVAFVAMGAVVLGITGAEALYADMGHFGRPPIRRAWFLIVFPALTLNYLGQGALILQHPRAASNPFFLMVPGPLQVPMVVLATLATVIASQAVISGAFSMTRQASRLGLLPPLRIRQTSEHEEGQVYLPFVNTALFVGVVALTLTFRSAERLATAYGVSVTGALVVDTVLLLVVARLGWRWAGWKLAVAAVAFGGIELTFLSANLTKVLHGGYLPLAIATVMFTIMTTWQAGRRVVTKNRLEREGSLAHFIEGTHTPTLPRTPGTAVFPHPSMDTTPLALRLMVERLNVLPEHVVIISATAANVPHVPVEDRLTFNDLGDPDDGIFYLQMLYGFADEPDIPQAVALAQSRGLIERDADIDTATYYLSRATIHTKRGGGLGRFRKGLFVFLARQATAPSFALPPERTVVMGSHVTL
jgi:KUP system potassium uptake protein